MQRTQFGDMACSIARTADVIGEPRLNNAGAPLA
jgi:hypothetical protein